MSQATFTFRVDESLKEAFSAIAQAQDRSSAQLLRDFMRDYVQNNADKISYDQWFKAKVEAGRSSALAGELYSLDSVETETLALKKSLRSKGA
jgi:predicted transcriptional regulator